jgi:glycosyltransferase involved in cell wall biosynthesis
LVRPLPAYKGWLLDRPRAAALFATDNEGFVEAIERLLDDKVLRAEIVQEGLKVGEENDLCVTGQRFLDAYRDILLVGDD